MNRTRYFRFPALATFASVVIGALASQAAAQVDTGAGREAHIQSYASDVGIDRAEAERRPMLRASIAALEERLNTEAASTFAGLYVEHTPQFRVVVKFTRPDAALALARYTQDQMYQASGAVTSLGAGLVSPQP